MVSLKSLLAVYLFFVAGGLAFSQRGTNLALSATAAASESLGDMPPKKANDPRA